MGDIFPGVVGWPNEFAVADEDTDVKAEAVLSVGDVDRGLELELELDREWVLK